MSSYKIKKNLPRLVCSFNVILFSFSHSRRREKNEAELESASFSCRDTRLVRVPLLPPVSAGTWFAKWMQFRSQHASTRMLAPN